MGDSIGKKAWGIERGFEGEEIGSSVEKQKMGKSCYQQQHCKHRVDGRSIGDPCE